jgi:hypothetical protein
LAGTAAKFGNLQGIAVTPDGAVYLSDGPDSELDQLGTDGTLTVIAAPSTATGTGATAVDDPTAVTVAPNGDLVFVNGGSTIEELQGSVVDLVAPLPSGYLVLGGTGFNGLAYDRSGDLLAAVVGENANALVVELPAGSDDWVLAAGIYGTGSKTTSGDGGPALSAGLGYPASIAVNPVSGNLELVSTDGPGSSKGNGVEIRQVTDIADAPTAPLESA